MKNWQKNITRYLEGMFVKDKIDWDKTTKLH